MRDEPILIGLDARTTYCNSSRGIGNYIYNLVKAILPLSRCAYRLYYECGTPKKPFDISPQIQDRRLRIKGSRFFAWEQVALPMALKKDRIQLYHAAANTAPWWQPCPTIVTIHDVLLSRMDDDETANYLFYWRKILPLCLTKASKIITVSEFSRLDLIDAFGVPPEKVQTIHSGRDTYFHQLPPKEMNELRVRYGIPKRFIFALGAQAPRKNTLRVLESFRLLRQAAKTDCALVISGLQPGMQEQLRAAVRDDPLARDIILLGFIEREHLRFLYNEAAVFLYPSLYEGFGFPLLEAMACGTPVASSDRSSLPEIADDAALFFDPENVEAMTESLCHILNDTETAELLRSKGLERCTHFDWTRSARETLGVYEEVLGSRGSGSLII